MVGEIGHSQIVNLPRNCVPWCTGSNAKRLGPQHFKFLVFSTLPLTSWGSRQAKQSQSVKVMSPCLLAIPTPSPEVKA
jgi:hypothetical protein